MHCTCALLCVCECVCACAHSPEQLEGDAEVVAEVEVLLHVDDVVQVVLVFPLHRVQDLQLN